MVKVRRKEGQARSLGLVYTQTMGKRAKKKVKKEQEGYQGTKHYRGESLRMEEVVEGSTGAP